MTANQINYFKAREDVRSHLAQEEIGRGNLANAAETNRINLIRSGIEAQNARTNSLLAQVRQYEAVETRRSNLARERETQRHNIAAENEMYRSNTAQEALRGQQLAEEARANQASEALRSESNYNDLLRIQETERSNRVTESQNEARLYEDAAKRKLESSKQAETERHNRIVEKQTDYRDYRTLNQGAVKTVSNFMQSIGQGIAAFIAA